MSPSQGDPSHGHFRIVTTTHDSSHQEYFDMYSACKFHRGSHSDQGVLHHVG